MGKFPADSTRIFLVNHDEFGVAEQEECRAELRRLLLSEAMQRAETEHQVDGMNADHSPVAE